MKNDGASFIKLNSARKAYIGRKYGRLLVVNIFRTEDSLLRADCVCECGKIKTVQINNLVKGLTQSCGCLRDEKKNIHKRKINESEYESIKKEYYENLKKKKGNGRVTLAEIGKRYGVTKQAIYRILKKA